MKPSYACPWMGLLLTTACHLVLTATIRTDKLAELKRLNAHGVARLKRDLETLTLSRHVRASAELSVAGHLYVRLEELKSTLRHVDSSNSKSNEPRTRAKRYAHAHHSKSMRAGCSLGTCQVVNLSHRLYRLLGKIDKDDAAGNTTWNPNSFGRRRRSADLFQRPRR
ncbi:pro-adrenomedullin-like isoform X2 [Lethenteron reissneri]|nr:pro-adrenomedullin-like isoform X2 [Lethenteron reissneri]XP_061420395.1 pro-adrenomedullin-like isoform X2 [Lethenteron reissneri]XP_061420396.1 pro-adrenomedullin-like isoform X2 [Lethenteron reissneri]XP_061420397.1 pro-adrenomedullin-like isoform X2 [Lethenteron reissneri]